MADDAQLARIEEVIQPVLRDRGLELVDVDWGGGRPEGGPRGVVWRAGGVAVGGVGGWGGGRRGGGKWGMASTWRGSSREATTWKCPRRGWIGCCARSASCAGRSASRCDAGRREDTSSPAGSPR